MAQTPDVVVNMKLEVQMPLVFNTMQEAEDAVFQHLIMKATMDRDWTTLRSWTRGYGYILEQRDKETKDA